MIKSPFLVVTFLFLAGSILAAPYPSGRNYENEQYLDGEQKHFLLRWTVFRTAKEIEMEFQVNCTGWFGISFSVGTIFVNATGDIIMGGYNDASRLPYIEDRWIDLGVPVPSNGGELDVRQDVTVIGAGYYEPWTVLRIRRKLDTGDSQDLPIIAGPMSVAWTKASSDDTSVPHAPGDDGSALVTFFA